MPDTRRFVSALLGAAAFACGAAAQADPPYIRVVDGDETVRMDVAVRTLAPKGHDGPLVQLVGAVHIADEGFYRSVQSFLDVHDLVLYEGVGGAREPEPEPTEGDEAAALATQRRVLFLSVLGEDFQRRTGRSPETTHALLTDFGGSIGAFSGELSRDGWGREILVETPEFDVVSLGADGLVGGEAGDSDIRASALLAQPLDIEPDEAAAGLQRDLAEALGLRFQLDGIDYSHPHWRNSDLDIGQIQEALGGAPAGAEPGDGLDPDAPDGLKAADMLFKTLSGESFLGKAASFLMKMLGSNPQGRALVKVMLADTLSQAELLLAAQPGGLAELMEVIIDDRNAAVVSDLRAVIEDEPEVRSVAIFYGAGHFGDLERRIVEELGYEYESSLWIPAMSVDLKEAGLQSSQVSMYRAMMKRMIEAQLKAAESARDE